ncbi:mixed lineage kinase domain-like protein isoform X2 [Trichomycterus rosablanca]
MDFIDPILNIAEKLYALCSEVKANKKRCRRLAKRVSTLTELVKVVKNNGLGSNPDMVNRGLHELKTTLESAEEVVKKYTEYKTLIRIVKVNNLREEFDTLNMRLNDAAQLLSLALQVEQREKIDEIKNFFHEDKRRKEDKEDTKCDNDELQNLLQSLVVQMQENKVSVDSVHMKVEQNQKDLQDIKAMMESIKKPSIHLPDIREITAEELSYEDSTKPFMTSNHTEVYKGEFNKFTVAIKRYTNTVNTSPEQIRKIFCQEVDTMKRFESPHILRMFGICVQNGNGPNPTYLIVMEFCEKGSLRQVLDGPNKLTWDTKIHMCLDAAQGLYRLHQSEQKFKVHGCLSSSKFLVAAGYTVKLGGFELAKTETSLKKTKTKKHTSTIYASPQQLEDVNYQYNKPCEIYSFGIVLWEIATQQVPFKDCSTKNVYKKVFEEKIKEPLPSDCPSELKKLIDDCRSFDPFQRPSAGVLVDKLQKLAQQWKEV